MSADESSRKMLDTLDVALYAFCLVPPLADESDSASLYRDVMASRTSREGLRRSADRDAMFAAQRLRLALELAPLPAIAYLSANPVARWKIVRDHLSSKYPNTSIDLITELARRVAETLADKEVTRPNVTNFRGASAKSNGKCATCHFDFAESPALTSLDPYKPYFLSPEELTAKEVDHIVAISGVGNNGIQNLQLLCRWCNFGKSDGLGVDIRKEALYAGDSIDEVPRSHRANMFYMTIADNDFCCDGCGFAGKELTVRPRDEVHGFLLSNLRPMCYDCVGV